MDHREHLAAATRWTPGTRMNGAQMAVGCLAIAGPVLAAALAGRMELGLAASMGGFMLSGVGSPARAWEHLREIGEVVLVALAAVALAALLAGTRYEAAIVVALVAAAALLGSLSRFAAILSMRFVLFMVLAVSVIVQRSEAWHGAAMIVAGIAWAAAVNVAFSAFAPHRAAAKPAEDHTHGQRLARWRRSLRHLAGWQYAIRLTACLAIALVIRDHWADKHFHWIAVTVALLTDRSLEPLPVKITQRAVGTVIGVLIAALVYWWQPTEWILVAAIAVLATLRPPLRTGNYLAYTIVTTPLILVILDAGAPQGYALLADRLVATLIGAVLVLGANALLRRVA